MLSRANASAAAARALHLIVRGENETAQLITLAEISNTPSPRTGN